LAIVYESVSRFRRVTISSCNPRCRWSREEMSSWSCLLLYQLPVLLLPVLALRVPIRRELLVPAHRGHHLVLEGGLLILGLFRVELLQVLDVLLVLHLHVVLLLPQELVLRPPLLDLLAVLVLELRHHILQAGLPSSVPTSPSRRGRA